MHEVDGTEGKKRGWSAVGHSETGGSNGPPQTKRGEADEGNADVGTQKKNRREERKTEADGTFGDVMSSSGRWSLDANGGTEVMRPVVGVMEDGGSSRPLKGIAEELSKMGMDDGLDLRATKMRGKSMETEEMITEVAEVGPRPRGSEVAEGGAVRPKVKYDLRKTRARTHTRRTTLETEGQKGALVGSRSDDGGLPSEQLDMSAHLHLKGDKAEGLKMRASNMAENLIGKSEENELNDGHTFGECGRTMPHRLSHHRAREDGMEDGMKSSRKRESWLMETIRETLGDRPASRRIHKCRFENTMAAARFNAKWMKHYGWDLKKALEKQKGTMLSPGSEFREAEKVRRLWGKHPNWKKLKEIITDGVTYPLEDLPEDKRKEDLDHMVARGNHKSAKGKKLIYKH